MFSGKFPKTLISCAFFALVGVGTSQAAPLATGSTILASAGAGPSGGSVVGSEAIPFSTANYSGTLTSQVISNDPSNPFGPGDLTFTYQLQNAAGSTDDLDRLTVASFAVGGLLTDASYQTPTTGVIPFTFDRNTSDVVGVSFASSPIGSGLVAPGTSSALLVIQTNATTFQSTSASVIDSLSTSVASFAPLAVPEPSTLVLAGLFGFAALRRK
jgi:hypothetical protein